MQVALNSRVRSTTAESPDNLMFGRRATKRMADDFSKETFRAACARHIAAVRAEYPDEPITENNLEHDTYVVDEHSVYAEASAGAVGRYQRDSEQYASRGFEDDLAYVAGKIAVVDSRNSERVRELKWSPAGEKYLEDLGQGLKAMAMEAPMAWSDTPPPSPMGGCTSTARHADAPSTPGHEGTTAPPNSAQVAREQPPSAAAETQKDQATQLPPARRKLLPDPVSAMGESQAQAMLAETQKDEATQLPPARRKLLPDPVSAMGESQAQAMLAPVLVQESFESERHYFRSLCMEAHFETSDGFVWATEKK
jgi:hypothetical protein